MAGHRRARGPGLRGGVLACAVIACALFGSGMMVLAVATSAQAQSLKTQAKQAAGQADTSQPVLLTADEVTVVPEGGRPEVLVLRQAAADDPVRAPDVLRR